MGNNPVIAIAVMGLLGFLRSYSFGGSECISKLCKPLDLLWEILLFFFFLHFNIFVPYLCAVK